MKRVISVLLTVVLLLTIAPLSSLADDKRTAEAQTGDITYTATTPFARLLKASAEEGAAEDVSVDAVCGISVEDGKATVTVRHSSACTVIVAIYDDSGENLLAYAYKDLGPDEATAELDLDISLPKYYMVRGFLTRDHKDLSPLSKPYENITHTSLYAEFQQKTTNDFDADLIDNLDESTDNNFCVFKDGTVVKADDGEHNIIVNADYTNAKYKFDNIDDDVRNLKAGDIFYYESEDAEILVKVKTIKITGDKAVITGDTEAGLEDFYQYIKIDTKVGLDVDAYKNDDDSELPEGMTYKVLDKNGNPLYDSLSKMNDLNPKLGKTYTGDLNVEGSIETKWKLEEGSKETLGGRLKFNGSIDVSVTVTPSGGVKLSLFEGDLFDLNVTLGLKAEENMTFSGSVTGEIPLKELKLNAGIDGFDIGVGLYIRITVGASFKFGFTQSIGIDVGFSTKEKFYNHSVKPLNEVNEFDVGADISITVALVSEVWFKLKKGDETLFGLEGSVEGGIKITATLFDIDKVSDAVKKNIRHDCNLCVSGIPSGYLQNNFSYTRKKKTKSVSPLFITVDIPEFGYSFTHKEFFFGGCPYKKYRVGISVVDENKKVLSGAEITYKDKDNKTQTITSDSNGKTNIYLPDGDYKITAAAKGSSKTISVNVNDTAQDVTIKINTEYVLNIGVRDKDGKFVSGADIVVSGNGITEKYVSDDKKPVTARLQAGEYTISAELGEEYGTETITLKDSISPQEITIKLDKQQVRYKLTVTVEDKDGNKISGAEVAVSGNGITENLTTADDGTATVELKNGEYTVTAEKDGVEASEKVKITGKKSVTITLDMQDDPDDPSDTEVPPGYTTGTLVTFGSYPQSRVTDETLLAKLNAKTLNWTYYDYYCYDRDFDGKQEDYMKYADITYSGTKYRAVTFSHYRPVAWNELGDASHTYQDDNGYEPDTIYWFKFEPIVWRVLDAKEGLLMSESLIDSQPFHNVYYYNKGYYGDPNYTHYASNWAYSSLRSWMNDSFYNTAFTTAKSFIKTTPLTTPSTLASTRYDADPTEDKVFLLSWDDAVLTKSYGFSGTAPDTNRIAYGTDYAKCQGLKVRTNEGQSWWLPAYDGASYWRLRTPTDSESTGEINYSGDTGKLLGTQATHIGIRPALKVNLKSAISAGLIKKVNSEDITSLKLSKSKVAVKLPSEHVGSDVKTETLKYNLGAAASKTASHRDCIAGNEYVFICVKDPESDLLADGNLLYIDQKTAESDTVEFTYNSAAGTELFFGKFTGDTPDLYIVCEGGRVGNTVTAKLMGTGLKGVTSLDLDISFDDEILQFESGEVNKDLNTEISEDWPGGKDALAVTTASKDDAFSNHLSFTLATVPPVSEESDTDVLATYTFKAVKFGDCEFKVDVTSATVGADEVTILSKGMTIAFIEPNSDVYVSLNCPTEVKNTDLHVWGRAVPGAELSITLESWDDADWSAEVVSETVGDDGRYEYIIPFSDYTADLYMKSEGFVVVKASVTLNGETAEETADVFYKFFPGDVNGDGFVLADDARLALRGSAKLEELTAEQTLAADVDGNGKVLADDARQILRFSAKLQQTFDKAQ
ncbi:MAG: carboxypeptidase regulatory-like domain-containing protein [Clostridia bacterium]|nr:carboxypeptidase regulatory-like domain-containing protein [Clostridia bacterium]